MVEVTIKDMLVGEKAYVIPWAVIVDLSGAVWIRADYPFHSEPKGTAQALIEKRADGFTVKVPRSYRYRLETISAEIKASLLPVIKIS